MSTMTPEIQSKLLVLAKKEVAVARRGGHLLGTMQVPGGWVEVGYVGRNNYTLTQLVSFDDKKRDELRALGLPVTVEECTVPSKLLAQGSLLEVATTLVPLYTLGE